jgi:hypothetical protein
MSKKPPAGIYYPGAVLADAMYTAHELVSRLGWDSEDVSLAMSKGLKAFVFADRVYVFGADVMEFIKSQREGGDA